MAAFHHGLALSPFVTFDRSQRSVRSPA